MYHCMRIVPEKVRVRKRMLSRWNIRRLSFLLQSREPRRKTITDNPANCPQSKRQRKPNKQERIQSDIKNGSQDTSKHNTNRQAYCYTYETSWMCQVAAT